MPTGGSRPPIKTLAERLAKEGKPVPAPVPAIPRLDINVPMPSSVKPPASLPAFKQEMKVWPFEERPQESVGVSRPAPNPALPQGYSTIPIDDDVPIPVIVSQQAQWKSYPFASLKIGQSFKFPSDVKRQSAQGMSRAAGKALNVTFLCAYVDNRERLRVWRTA